jgi:FK506-binding protein 1
VKLQDGKKFDSSRDREKPFKFKLGAEQVIPGLDEAVERLCIKERAKIFIPSDKAYGRKGFPGLVPPNTHLVFDLELLTFR